MKTISYSIAGSLNNNADPPVSKTSSIEDFVEKFHTSAFSVSPKKQWAKVWMPCTFTQPSRQSEHVSHMSAFVVDYDTGTDADLQSHVQRLTTSNHHFVVHSSYGYKPPEVGKARFIFFLDAPIPTGTEWRWSDAIWPRLAEYLGFSADADRACRDASRAFFLPIKRGKTSPVFSYYHAGENLITTEVLGDILSRPIVQYDFRRPYVSEQDPAKEINLRDLSFRLLCKFGNIKKPHGNAVQRVLSAEATPAGDRHETLRLFTHALARVADPEEPSEKLIAVMYPWLDKLGSRADESEALRALEGARAKIPTWDARAQYEIKMELGLLDSGVVNGAA